LRTAPNDSEFLADFTLDWNWSCQVKSSRPTYPLLLTKNIIPATEMTEQQIALPGLTNVFIFEATPRRPA
jgi:hypothetical protein